MTGCPSAAALRGYLAGGLPDPELDAVADHVEGCRACAAAVRELEAAPDPLVEAVRRAGVASTVAGPPDGPPGGPPGLPGYELLERVGAGGMGVVYKARQRGLNRPVAVKLVLGGAAAGPATLVRFLAEAEAVAAVRHPHVVQVYEFGHHDGQPYLAMEYCPGGTLDARLGGRRLDPGAAAGLVGKVAAGVAAAHAEGIVHRDLKPANVLFDAAGEPKVTDFGLAKRGAGGDLTVTHALLGTPAYMPPEQAAGGTKFAGPPADVWALGVVLYEALTGRRPFAAADPYAVLRQVVEADPPRPRALAPAVPRDLELICRKCLRKEPHERYPTAAELADDLGAFLAGRPVAARPVPAPVVVWKWARRNRAVAASLLLAGLALVGGAGVSTWQAVRATAEAGRADGKARELDEALTVSEARRAAAEAAQAEADAQRREADRGRGDAEAAVDFFRRYFLDQAAARPGRTIRAALDEAAGNLGVAFAGRPHAEAYLRYTVGNLYRVMGRPDEAAGHLRRAADLYARLDPPDAAGTTGISLANLGAAYLAGGRPADAAPAFEQALAVYAPRLRPDNPFLVDCRFGLAVAYLEVGRAAAAAAALRPVLPHLPPDDLGRAGLLASCGRDLLRAGRPADAEPLLRACLAIREGREPTAWTTANARSLLGGALLGQGKLAEAGPLLTAGYEGLRAAGAEVPPAGRFNLGEAADRLVELYAAWGGPDELARWRAERARYPFVAPPPRPAGSARRQ